MKNFDVGKNIVTLLPEWVSRANAKQRSGRAGRSVSVISVNNITFHTWLTLHLHWYFMYRS